MKIKNYWRISYKRNEYDTIYYAVVKAKKPVKAIQRFYKEYRLRWFENASNYIVVKIKQLEVGLNEKED